MSPARPRVESNQTLKAIILLSEEECAWEVMHKNETIQKRRKDLANILVILILLRKNECYLPFFDFDLDQIITKLLLPYFFLL